MSTSRPFVQYGPVLSFPGKKTILEEDADNPRPDQLSQCCSRWCQIPSAGDSGTLNVEIYQQDGDFIKDIEVNDLRNRYTLTKGSTQKMVNTHSCTSTH